MIFFFEYICLILIGIGLYNLIEQLPSEHADQPDHTSHKTLRITGGLGLMFFFGVLLFFLLQL